MRDVRLVYVRLFSTTCIILVPVMYHNSSMMRIVECWISSLKWTADPRQAATCARVTNVWRMRRAMRSQKAPQSTGLESPRHTRYHGTYEDIYTSSLLCRFYKRVKQAQEVDKEDIVIRKSSWAQASASSRSPRKQTSCTTFHTWV